jgi:hypothetical protein
LGHSFTLTMNSTEKTVFLHPVPEHILQSILEMDSRIGECMQQRADVVNQVIKELAVFNPGDFVNIYRGNEIIAQGRILQPLFVKKLGLVTYRVRTTEGEEFTNHHYYLELAKENKE